MAREALHVAMTRGRDANITYVATDAVDPTCDQLPDVQVERGGRDILSQILATSRAKSSATQTLRRRWKASHDRSRPVPATTLQLLTPRAPARRPPCRIEPHEVIDLTVRADNRFLLSVEEAAERLGSAEA
jgi:hypothetical protein